MSKKVTPYPLSSERKASTKALMHLTRKRVAEYARVSNEEQTRGNYPSCDSQLEELEAACLANGWEAKYKLRDDGYSAGSLRRPGMTELRWLVENGEIDIVLCTWYDRLTRSRDFYVLDTEFKAHGVEFITLHDPTDTKTASGRFMESMLVAAKTYEREQTSEKIRTKKRMRAQKGMWAGGKVPYGFRRVPDDVAIEPDESFVATIESMFRVYCDSRSDYQVRQWLLAHQIPDPQGNDAWKPSTIYNILNNRRYIAQVEINKANKNVPGLPESEQYRIVPAEHGSMITEELFMLAQSIRQEKSADFPNCRGRPRTFSKTQCGYVYLLQGIIRCACCGHAMSPYYVHHRAGEHGGKKRKKDSYVTYYCCAKHVKQWQGTNHKNVILARRVEQLVLDEIAKLATSPVIVEAAMQIARSRYEAQVGPEKGLLTLNRQGQIENQTQIDRLLTAITSGQADVSLLGLLNEKANELKLQREKLRQEERHLQEALTPLEDNFDAASFQHLLTSFQELVLGAEREELQRLLRLLVRRIEWGSDGSHKILFHQLPKALRLAKPPQEPVSDEEILNKSSGPKAEPPGRWSVTRWLDTKTPFDGAKGASIQPLVLAVWYDAGSELQIEKSSVSRLEDLITVTGDNVIPE